MADEHKPQADATDTGSSSTKTLYELSVCRVADRFTNLKKYLICLPENILFDVYYELYKKNKLCLLGAEFNNLDTFSKMLRVRNKRIQLFQVFQALMDHGTKIDNELAISYNVCCLEIKKKSNCQANIIDLGLKLGSFLSDAGWYAESTKAYGWSVAALKELKPTLPPRITIDVLRQAAKSCVVKREFKKAGLLIRQAVYLAREVFDKNHPKFCDVLIDYGFHLLNFDSITNSVHVYQNALQIREQIFGRTNLHVAIAHEDLAYALYVREYSSGRFTKAREHVERAIDIMEKLLPYEHLMLASAKRVKALILEEIALDNEQDNGATSNKDLLLESEYLHLSALRLAQTAFGERNVQTAKHYGNLGRLYQSMSRFQEAEEMHLKAISIKEELLGSNDYEVGLSIGHLASLYNFHMDRYRDAEKLYYRSIAINLKLFGKSYSGLEYDYRGLLHVYEKLHEYDKLLEYRDTLICWNDLRKQYNQSEHSPIDLNECPQPIENVIKTFFSM
ncbi:GSCOCG00003404001-RA-CDS [Cotesia congregata]|nr:GSCOCG00003404001-RA-CDS [Cotesia congregata]